MTDDVVLARLAAAQWECDRHRAALDEALAEWHTLAVPSVQDLETDSALRRLTDQILYRFTKLQDAMGERLLPATLSWLREPHESWPMRDRLDRLERLAYLDVNAWLAWRDVRNRLAHEYPGEADRRHAVVLATMDAAAALLGAYRIWRARLPGWRVPSCGFTQTPPA